MPFGYYVLAPNSDLLNILFIENDMVSEIFFYSRINNVKSISVNINEWLFMFYHLWSIALFIKIAATDIIRRIEMIYDCFAVNSLPREEDDFYVQVRKQVQETCKLWE